MGSVDSAVPVIIFGVIFFSLFAWLIVSAGNTIGTSTTGIITGAVLVQPTCNLLSLDIFGCGASYIGYFFALLGVTTTNPFILMLIVLPFMALIIYLLIVLVRG